MLQNYVGMRMTSVSKFDAADYLRTPEAIAAYLIEAFATHDSAYISAAVDTIARAKGMANVAKASAQQSNSSGGKT
jgi:probable addiction module antidote protein